MNGGLQNTQRYVDSALTANPMAKLRRWPASSALRFNVLLRLLALEELLGRESRLSQSSLRNTTLIVLSSGSLRRGRTDEPRMRVSRQPVIFPLQQLHFAALLEQLVIEDVLPANALLSQRNKQRNASNLLRSISGGERSNGHGFYGVTRQLLRQGNVGGSGLHVDQRKRTVRLVFNQSIAAAELV